MDENQTRQQAGETITDEVMWIEFDRKHPSFLERILIKCGALNRQFRYKVTAPFSGTMFRISKKALSVPECLLKNDEESSIRATHQLLAEHGRTICEIVALAIQNNSAELDESLVKNIMWNLEPKELKAILLTIVSRLDFESFLSSTISATGMNILRPKNDLQ